MDEVNSLQETKDRVQEDISLSKQWKLCLPQVLACCLSHSIVVNSGTNLVFSAVLLPQLMSSDSQLPITNDNASWIASLVAIATPVGSLLIGPIMDAYGRRTGCKLCALIMCVSWILLAVSNNVPMIYCARLLCGLTTGLSTVALVYVSEISHPLVRPALLSLNSVFFSLGILWACLAGSWLSWRSTALCSASFCALQLALLWLVPESPEWLAIKSNRYEDSSHWSNAESSLRWLYRNELVSNHEIMTLRRNYQEVNDPKTLSLPECIKCFRRKTTLKPLFLLIVLFVLQQSSGAYVLIFYAVNVFQKVSGTIGFDSLKVLILMGIIRFTMSVIVSIMSHKVGRRPLLMSSFIGMCVTSMALGIRLYSSATKNQSNLFVESDIESSVMSIVCILLFVCFSALGVLVIPWTLVVELLPVQIRGFGGGIMVSWAYIIMFIHVKSFPYILNLIGLSSMFFILSSTCFVGFLFIYRFLPETFGRSFSEIEMFFCN